MQTLNNITVTANTSQAVSAVQVLNNQWSEMNNALSLVGRGLSTAASLAGSFVAVGTKIENVNKAAQAMSKYGLGKGMLQALRAETADVVDQMVLAQNATKLLGSGAVQSVKEMTDAFKWAIAQGDRIGVSANEAVQLITNTLIGGEAEALKRFGVQMELTGTKAEKTAKLMGMIQKEIKYSDDAFAVTAAGFGEKMQQMKNSMLDAVEGFSLFNKGFNLISGSVEWVTKKLKKSAGEIWSDIDGAGKIGLQKLQDDVARTVSALTEAKISGDTASVDFLQKKLDKTVQDGQAFLLQFGDLYDQFGKAAGAAEPVQMKQDVTEVLAAARAAAQDAEADIDRALDKISELDERGIAIAKRDAKDSAQKLADLNQRLKWAGDLTTKAIKDGDAQEVINKRLQLQDEIRADILKVASESAAASNMVYLLEQGQDELLRRKDRILAGHFSTLLKTLDTERKAVEERRKYGKILDNGVAAEKNLEAMKKDYIAILDGQLKIATQLNDQAKMKYLIEAKDKAAAIKTLADLEKQLKEQEVKDDKKKTEVRIDEEKRELAFLRLRRKLVDPGEKYSADVISDLDKQITKMEGIVRLTGSARVAELDRGRAITANEQAMKSAEAARKKMDEEKKSKILAEAEKDRKDIDDWVKKIKFFDTEHTKIIENLRTRYAELQEIRGQNSKEGRQILDTMEMIGRGAQQLATDTEKLAQPTQEQIEIYKRLSEEFARALAAGDQKLADSLRYRMTLMRSEATTIEEIAKKGRESESKLLYAQYAQESLRQSIADKELELKAALRDKSYERAAALRDEITALQQQAEANGQAMKKMEEIQRQYRTLGEVGSSAISAISQAAWADKEALEKYHGSRLKMAQDLFADEMKKKAISETVLGFSAAGQASLASVFAPAAAPALWASSALHFLAAGATGLIGAGLDVSTGTGGGGGGGSSASSAKTGFGDTAPESYKPQEVVVNVNLSSKDGWIGNMVDMVINEQRRGKARRGVM